ncbi:hypothetical protein Leryth_026278 [Lithospermum erythrorhizon]|nr:hypothetical protein Leryth_026278 [Lithospermum erythrorhizon]
MLYLIHSRRKLLKEELVQGLQSQLGYAIPGATVTSSLRSREKCDSSNWKQTSLVKELQGVSATKVDSASKVSCKELFLKSSRPPKDMKIENIELATPEKDFSLWKMDDGNKL